MLLDAEIPPKARLLARFAEKKLDLLFSLNNLNVTLASGQGAVCDFVVELADASILLVEVKWFDSDERARHYVLEVNARSQDGRPAGSALAIVVGHGDTVLMDPRLKDLLTLVPDDTTVKSFSQIFNQRAHLRRP